MGLFPTRPALKAWYPGACGAMRGPGQMDNSTKGGALPLRAKALGSSSHGEPLIPTRPAA